MRGSGSGSTGPVVQVDRQEDVVGHRVPELLGQLADQPGGAGQQREPAQQLQRQAEVGERRTAHARAVEREPLAEHLARAPGRSPRTARRCGPNWPSSRAISISRGVRGSPSLCTWWPRPGTNRAGLALAAHDVQRDARPSRRRRWAASSRPADHLVQEPAAVLGDPEEAGAAAEQPRGERALHRVGRREVGQPGHDRGRGEAVVGQRGEHGLEDPDLARSGTALGREPERELAEADVAHHVAGEVLAEQGDRVAAGGAQRGGVRRLLAHDPARPARPAARRRARPAPVAAARSSPACRRSGSGAGSSGAPGRPHPPRPRARGRAARRPRTRRRWC